MVLLHFGDGPVYCFGIQNLCDCFASANGLLSILKDVQRTARGPLERQRTNTNIVLLSFENITLSVYGLFKHQPRLLERHAPTQGAFLEFGIICFDIPEA